MSVLKVRCPPAHNVLFAAPVKSWLARRSKSTRESSSQRDQNNTRLTEAEEVALVDEVRRRRKRRQASEIRRIASTQLDEQRHTWCDRPSTREASLTREAQARNASAAAAVAAARCVA
jgi:hypothetical protein